MVVDIGYGGSAVVVLDLTDKVDQDMFDAAFLGQSNLTPWDLDHDGNEVLRAGLAGKIFIHHVDILCFVFTSDMNF